MNNDHLYNEFLRITKELNQSLGITPILYGSLGLETVTKLDFSPQDIDILVPIKYINSEWESLKQTMEELNYSLVDLHEHKFVKEEFEVGIAYEEDLPSFAGVKHESLEVIDENGVTYRLLTVEDYLNVYKKSLKDGYRRTKNNSKDMKKIEVLENL